MADDQVEIDRDENGLTARPPATIAGLLEVRGVGIITLAYEAPARLSLLIDLVGPDAVDRLPEEQWEDVSGLPLRRFCLYAREVSAAAKVRLAVQVVTGNIILVP